MSTTYITGFCSTGSCEGTSKRSPSGLPMPACRGTYVIPSGVGGRSRTYTCSHECHKAFAEIREMMAAMNAMHGIAQPGTAGAKQETHSPTGVARPAAVATTAATAAPPPARHGGLVPPVPSSRTFSPTPTGRAARGQLEEQVRVSLKQYQAFVSMGTITPAFLSKAIDKEKPPSQGAVAAVLERWEKKGLIEIARKPLRVGKVTSLGERILLK